MASLATHFSASVLFIPIGLRRLVSSSSLFLQNPSHFRSKLWYFSDQNFKNFDLYALLIALPIASFSELFIFFSFSGHPNYRFSFIHQSLTLLAFWVLIILIIVREFMGTSLVNESFVFVFGGAVFLMEYSVMGKGVSGLAGVLYGFLGGLTLVCAGSCIYLSVKPSAFFAEFLLCSGMVFKGTWLLQAGFSLYTDAFGLKGCQKVSFLEPQKESLDVHCDLVEDSLRGVALMHFLFTVHAIVVMILGVGVFGVLASNRSMRCGEARGPLLAELESTGTRMRALPELEMD
ncbi:uncharacterized protein LOC113872271 [Abrus precatorius]|uniref:Uncharacterized protein LOC113872271 n=1 Tax=Abrus precatorius TaxID=3816 RepID=A0A8B8MAC5_ABRPR|nr:uncharacterized protein LOC113872271 [Abrus precatorius]